MPRVRLRQASFAAGEVSPSLYGRDDVGRRAAALARSENFVSTAQGALLRRPGTRFAGAARYGDKRCELVPFVFNDEDAYAVEFGDGYARFWRESGGSLGFVQTDQGAPYTVATVYDEAAVQRLASAQSGDVLYLVDGARAPQLLKRLTASAWAFEPFAPKRGPFLDERPEDEILIRASAQTGQTVLTASADLWEAGHVGALWALGPPKGYLDLFAWGAGQTGYPKLCVSEDRVYLQVTSVGTMGGTRPRHEEGDASDGLETWRFLFRRWGVARITAVVAPNQVQADVIDALPSMIVEGHAGYTGEAPWNGSGTKYWREGAWSGVQGYPAAVQFFGERLAFLSTTKRPGGVWLSAPGDFEDFAHGAEADEAMALSLLGGRVNAARWARGRKKLLIGHSDGVSSLGAPNPAAALSAANVAVERESETGSEAVQPVSVGASVLYAERGGRKLRALAYRFEADAFDAADLTLLADHILKGRLARLAYTASPLGVVWCGCRDGTLRALTYEPEESVVAWSRMVPGGSNGSEPAQVESLCVTPSPADGRDALWLAVRRTVNGAEARHIERLEAWFDPDDGQDKANMFFVDAGLTYDGAPQTTVSGLGHLVGETVQVVADGGAHPDCVVGADGRITLKRAAARVHAGLACPAFADTLVPALALGDGSAAGVTRIPYQVSVQVAHAIGAEAGWLNPETGEADLLPLYDRRPADAMDASPPLRSEFKTSPVRGGSSPYDVLRIAQRRPFALKVVGVTMAERAGAP